MSNPIIFISNQRIKEGQLAGYKEYYQQVAAITEATKPGTAAHLAYANEDGTRVAVVHIFPDAQAMEAHMKGVGELARNAGGFMEVVSVEIYGRPSDAVLEFTLKVAGSGVTLSIKPESIGGYIRLKPGA
jgi:quinol monooxygenase YgiN